MSREAKWIWKAETPCGVPAGARISAGKSGSVARSFPTTAVASVKRLPVSCMPSPESPAKRTTTRSIFSTVLWSMGGLGNRGLPTSVAPLAGGQGIVRRPALDPAAAVDTAGGRGSRVLDGVRQLEDDRVVEPDLVRGDSSLHLAAVVELDRGVGRVDHAFEAGGVGEQDVALAPRVGGCIRRGIPRGRAIWGVRPGSVPAGAVHEDLDEVLASVLVELVAVVQPEGAVPLRGRGCGAQRARARGRVDIDLGGLRRAELELRAVLHIEPAEVVRAAGQRRLAGDGEVLRRGGVGGV